jgi:hypothetical protein
MIARPAPLLASLLSTLAALAWLATSTAAQHPIARVNCGGPGIAITGFGTFDADAAYGGAVDAGYEGGVADGSFGFVGGQDNPYEPVLKTSRVGFTAYRVDVAPGDYILRLHFAEYDHFVHGPGLRVFDLLAEGQVLVDDLDIAHELGLSYGGVVLTTVTVTDGTLDLETVGGDDPAVLCALEVLTLPPAPDPLPAVSALAAEPGFHRNLLTWDHTLDKAQAGWRVFRSTDPGGPFAPVADLWASPPRFHDDGVVDGVTYHYQVAGLDTVGGEGPLSATVSAAAMDHADSELPVYQITVDPADLAVLDADPSSNDEVTASFLHDGQSFDVAVRYRGAGSRLHPKKSWKVEFPPGDTFQGRRELALKAYWLDDTIKRDRVSQALYEAIGYPVPRHEFVHLEVNGVYRGLYNSVEKIDADYLAARDRDDDIWMHRARVNPFGESNMSVLPTLEHYQTSYEIQINTGAGYDQLIAFIELVNDPTLTPAGLAEVFDVDGYLDHLAVVLWTGDVDQIQRNYFLAWDPTLQRWEWIGWDNDRCLVFPDTPVDAGTSTCGACNLLNVLRDVVLADPGFRWRYVEKLSALSAGAASDVSIAALLSELHGDQALAADADVEKRGWESEVPFDDGVVQHNAYAVGRNAFLPAALAAYQPATPPTTLWINEFLARNVNGDLDETGVAEDWVELYNASGAPFDASGLHLTGELSNPTAYAFPPGTIVPPFGYLTVWADNDLLDGPLHVPFELDGDGEELALFAADGTTLLDVIHYGPQEADVSEGRGSDGGPFFRLLPSPTRGGPNTTAGNLPPLVTWIEHSPASPGVGEPVTVTCLVDDDDLPLALTLRYTVNGGAPVDVGMAPLPASRWAGTIPGQADGAVVAYQVEGVDGLGATTSKPHKGPEVYTVFEPVPNGLRIAEFMADNDAVFQDGQGDFDDWIEIANESGGALSLDGLTLTDDLQNPFKWPFPAGTNLLPGERLVVIADDDPGAGPLHATFKLGAGGEEIGLFAPGPLLVDGFSFGPQATDVSQGHLTGPGSADVVLGFLDATPGLPNGPAAGGAVRTVSPADLLDLASLTDLTCPVPPTVGGPFQVTLTTGVPTTPVWMVLGALPDHLFLGGKGTLLLELLPGGILVFATDGTGVLDLPMTVPNDPLLADVALWIQVFTPGLGLSNGLGVKVGP